MSYLPFDEVEWVRGIGADEDSGRASSSWECQHVSVGGGRGRRAHQRLIGDLLDLHPGSPAAQINQRVIFVIHGQLKSELSALTDLDVEPSCFHGA